MRSWIYVFSVGGSRGFSVNGCVENGSVGGDSLFF